MSIPKIIHQTWKDHDIPYDIFKKKWVDSWKTYHPEWEHRFWTDEDLRNLIKESYPWFLQIYDAYEYNICRVDAARYFIMHKFGGLYVDLDFECFGNFDDLLSHNLVLGFSHYSDHYAIKQYSIPNALIMSSPRHQLWNTIFLKMGESFSRVYGENNLYKDECKSTKVFELTGPILLYHSIIYYRIVSGKKDYFIAPKDFFYPHINSKGRYAKTYWSGSWYEKWREK